MERGTRILLICLLLIVSGAISYLAVSGIFAGVCWAFGLDIWSWKISLGIWIILLVIGSIIRKLTKK